MKKFFASTVCAGILFVGCGATTDTTDIDSPVTDTDTLTTPSSDESTAASVTSMAEIQTLMQENAQLMVQAGSVGIDAQEKQEWVMQGQAAAQKLATQDYAGAGVILETLNAEMRAAIAAAQQ